MAGSLYSLLQMLLLMGSRLIPINIDNSNDHPDAGLTLMEIVNKNGYRIERHTVTTEDGYILTLFRIPTGSGSYPENNQLRPAVLVIHGLFCSGLNWVNTETDRGLGYVLADRGYDVWLANVRGATDSRKHTKYNTTDREYWNFSFHEIAMYDLPKFIDYIIHITSQEKIFYIGHSQGSTILPVLASEKPEYNNKIRLGILLAPVTFPNRMKNLLFRSIASFQNLIENAAAGFGIYEIPLINPATKMIVNVGCSKDSFYLPLCKSLLFNMIGFNDDTLDSSLLSLHLTQSPAGFGLKQLFHYTQLLNIDKFQQYDYGSAKNILKYNRTDPPRYDLSKITIPIALFRGDNDLLSTEYDVTRLEQSLPNSIKHYEIEDKNFNHMDFLWAKNVVEKVYNSIVLLLQNY